VAANAVAKVVFPLAVGPIIVSIFSILLHKNSKKKPFGNKPNGFLICFLMKLED